MINRKAMLERTNCKRDNKNRKKTGQRQHKQKKQKAHLALL